MNVLQLWIVGAMVFTFIDAQNGTEPIMLQAAPQVPCNCYYKDSCGCVCPNPITWEEFQVLPQHFRSCPAFTLALRGGQFNSFPGDYFNRVGSTSDFVLDVSNCDFQNFLDLYADYSPLHGVTFTISALIRINEVAVTNTWNWGSFYDLTPADSSAYCEIQVLRSTVYVLTRDFSRICQGVVTVVNIISSGMNSIEDGAFANFWKLTEVNLSGNQLTNIKRSHFSSPASELQDISLANNQIQTLPTDMFSRMPSLVAVDLRNNPISTLDEPTYGSIFHNVQLIGLESFPLRCNCQVRWLKDPNQMCGVNLYGLAGIVCRTPQRLNGVSFYNDTRLRDLVC